MGLTATDRKNLCPETFRKLMADVKVEWLRRMDAGRKREMVQEWLSLMSHMWFNEAAVVAPAGVKPVSCVRMQNCLYKGDRRDEFHWKKGRQGRGFADIIMAGIIFTGEGIWDRDDNRQLLGDESGETAHSPTSNCTYCDYWRSIPTKTHNWTEDVETKTAGLASQTCYQRVY